MRNRTGFVSNSSSSSFIIHNKTLEQRAIIDFLKENTYLVDDYNKEYSATESLSDLILEAETTYKDIILNPGSNHCVFGDENGDCLGRVFDYILRNGGSSNTFSWHFDAFLR